MALSTYYKNTLQYWPSALWLLVVLYLSTMQVPDIKQPSLFNIPHKDKLVHAAMYFIMAIFLQNDFRKFTLKRKRGNVQYNSSYVWHLVFACFYGLCMEGVQLLFCAQRSGDWLDALANVAGVLSAGAIFKALMKRDILFKK